MSYKVMIQSFFYHSDLKQFKLPNPSFGRAFQKNSNFILLAISYIPRERSFEYFNFKLVYRELL
jgi:hypothetical protein